MTFKESMLKDIAKGLTYLHGSCIGAHGRLSSDQCVIDSRWTVQVSTVFALSILFYSSTLFRIVQLFCNFTVRSVLQCSFLMMLLPTDDAAKEFVHEYVQGSIAFEIH
jgi:hypothetical protein